MSNAEFAEESTAPTLEGLDERELVELARDGDQDAYATLFSRYSYPAYRLARHLGRGDDSDDVVAESFAKVLDLVCRGKGSDVGFRAYLFTAIRHEAANRATPRRVVDPRS